MKSFSCGAGHGEGGLGRHLAELVEDARQRGELARYYSRSPRLGDEAGVGVTESLSGWLGRWTPVRFSPGRRSFYGFDRFDRAVARVIEPGETHVGFSLQSLRTFAAARDRGCKQLELVSPTCHIDRVRRRYHEAFKEHPIERSWLDDRACEKARREYEAADTIVVASDYVHDSFLESGFPEEKLSRFDLTASARYMPGPSDRPDDGVFRVVYVGALTVAKGIPVLLDAFTRFDEPRSELLLLGGWGTRGMRRYLQAACARDARIRIVSGDPLDYLRHAEVFVQPSYQDGLSYALLEALACGVRVIVTEDTGGREVVRDGTVGTVVPTGSSNAIVEALRDAYRTHNPDLHRALETQLTAEPAGHPVASRNSATDT